MRTNLRILTLTLILLSAVSVLGQTEARLFSRLGPAANCESVLAQLDAWNIELQNDPATVGVIVTYRDPARNLDAFFRESMIKRYLTTRRMDLDRVSLIQGESRPEMTTEIWTVPAGAEKPRTAGADWSYDLSAVTAPITFGLIATDGVGGCENYDLGLLVKFLEANPSMTVKTVVKETSPAKYRAAVKGYRDSLAENGIARNRLTASYVRVARGRYLESTEMWLMPGKTPPTDEPRPNIFKAGVVNGLATVLPRPDYSATARALKASGPVNVEVLIDEQGNVISAVAVSGHPLLRSSAVKAARSAKFPPNPGGPPGKLKGILVYNFVP